MKASRIIEALVRAVEGDRAARVSGALAHFVRSAAPPRISPSDAIALRAFSKKWFASLVPLVASEDAAVRHAAGYVLGLSGRPAAVGPLFSMLARERDWFDHDYALAALAALGDAALVELEMRALSRDANEAALALAAMAQCRGDVFAHLERVRAKKKKLPARFFHAYRNVADPRALPVLFAALRDRAHAEDALEAAEEILCTAGFGRATKKERAAWADAIAPRLASLDVNVRAQALVCIGRLGADAHLAAVKAALEDDDPDVVAAGASALSHLGSKDALDALAAALADRRAVVRTVAAATWISRGHARGAAKKRALDILVDGVTALPDEWARERAVLTLRDIRGGEAALLASMSALSASRKKRAAEALVEMAHLGSRPDASYARMHAALSGEDLRTLEAAWARREREETAIAKELDRVRKTEAPRSKPPRRSRQ